MTCGRRKSLRNGGRKIAEEDPAHSMALPRSPAAPRAHLSRMARDISRADVWTSTTSHARNWREFVEFRCDFLADRGRRVPAARPNQAAPLGVPYSSRKRLDTKSYFTRCSLSSSPLMCVVQSTGPPGSPGTPRASPPPSLPEVGPGSGLAGRPDCPRSWLAARGRARVGPRRAA